MIATGPALEELKRLARERLGETDHVFPGLAPGRPIDPRAAFTAACKIAKLTLAASRRQSPAYGCTAVLVTER